METPNPDAMEARLAKLESRVVRAEKRLFESQLLVARKLMEIFATLKKHQELRDAHMQQTLARLLEQLAEIKAHLAPVLGPTPTTTH